MPRTESSSRPVPQVTLQECGYCLAIKSPSLYSTHRLFNNVSAARIVHEYPIKLCHSMQWSWYNTKQSSLCLLFETVLWHSLCRVEVWAQYYPNTCSKLTIWRLYSLEMVSLVFDRKSVRTGFDPCTPRIQNTHWSSVRPVFFETTQIAWTVVAKYRYLSAQQSPGFTRPSSSYFLATSAV